MKKITVALGLLIIASTGVIAQKSNSVDVAGSGASSAATSAGRVGSIESGTQIAGQLQNSLDAKNAKIGDQVILKTTSSIKQDGRVVVPEGSKLIGRVTGVQQSARKGTGSQIGVVFDTLQQGGKSIPISAVVTSITQARASDSTPIGGDDMMTSGSTTSTTSSRSSGGGGLLGGVTNTVGGVVNTAANTVGGVTNTAGQTVGSTTQTVGGTLSGLQISQSTDASAGGSSTLSLSSGNLRIDKGATFNLRVSQAATVN